MAGVSTSHLPPVLEANLPPFYFLVGEGATSHLSTIFESPPLTILVEPTFLDGVLCWYALSELITILYDEAIYTATIFLQNYSSRQISLLASRDLMFLSIYV